MKTFRVKLEINSGFNTLFQADTIFGGLCWAIRYCEGIDALRSVLDDFRSGVPWFILSNAFPGDLLPKPMIRFKQCLLKTKEEQIFAAKEGKRLKKINYVTPEEFISLVNGQEAKITNKEEPFISNVTLHNQINRLSGTTKNGHLYEQEEYYLNPKYEYLSIYIKMKDDKRFEWLLNLLKRLGETGLGKRKSTGKGSFRVVGFEECNLFNIENSANAFVSLSNFVPAPCDPVKGNFKIMVKYGKVGEDFSLSVSPFKFPLLMIQAGSVFRVNGKVKSYYGQMVENIAPRYSQVLQYGLAFSVPARLEEAN